MVGKAGALPFEALTAGGITGGTTPLGASVTFRMNVGFETTGVRTAGACAGRCDFVTAEYDGGTAFLSWRQVSSSCVPLRRERNCYIPEFRPKL
jgi:hypothetical protein